MDKVSVKGDDMAAIYQFLTQKSKRKRIARFNGGMEFSKILNQRKKEN